MASASVESMSASEVPRLMKNTDSIVFEDESNEELSLRILKRLQASARPEPIKIACVAPPPGQPPYFNEEYHGRISKEEEKRLLEGKSGRYLVRESFSNQRLNEYTLAFNFDDEINYVRLFYFPTNKNFKTDNSDKDYRTVLELITDVLGIFQRLKKNDSSISLKKEKYQYSKQHVFKLHFYKHPKWCDKCRNFLWGVYKQGYKCEDCDMNVHKDCRDEAPLPCSKVYVVRKFSKESKADKAKRNSQVNIINPVIEKDSYYEVLRKNEVSGDCSYFKECSRFLSAFQIRDKYIDINHSLTRCFCDNCMNDQGDNLHKGALMCDTLKQWTRFHFSEQEAVNKESVKNWDIVYFAIHPKCIEEKVKACYNKTESTPDQEDIIVTPSLAYTAQDMKNENWSYKFKDTRTNDDKKAQTVLEMYLRPNSYIIQPSFPNEWDDSFCHDIVPERWKVEKINDFYPKSILVKIFDDK